MGEKLSDLEVFHPDRMASRILGMGDILSLIEKVEMDIDAEKDKERAQEIYKNEKKAVKKYNKIIAEKLIFSIEFLKNSKSLKDVADYNNFRLHELKYERKGQFAIDLGKTTGYRLIIEPITVNEKNEIISYESINIVEIMEVSNHYE